jgi:acyl carrier protein
MNPLANTGRYDFTLLSVIEVIAANKFTDIDESDVKLDSTFEDLGLDSLSMVELLIELEDEFDVDLYEDSWYFENVKDLVNVIVSKI